MVGSAGSLSVGTFGPSTTFGQTEFIPGAQESTAHVWEARTLSPMRATTYPYGPYYSGYGDVSGAIVDKRPMAMFHKKMTIFGVTMPLWGWIAAGFIAYKVIK